MHNLASTFVLGYHGCDREVGERLLDGEDFKPSANQYDWLGSGVYFWEANPERGLDFVKELKQHPKFKDRYKKPFVIGAVIELRNCLDLTTHIGIQNIGIAYDSLVQITKKAGSELPVNNGLLRRLDYAVVTQLHLIIEENCLTPIDTVKGVFVEGSPIYPCSSFHKKTHIQICVCNPSCIKGVFRVKGIK